MDGSNIIYKPIQYNNDLEKTEDDDHNEEDENVSEMSNNEETNQNIN